MKLRGAIGAADFLIACTAIPEAADPKVRAALAALLGYELRESSESASSSASSVTVVDAPAPTRAADQAHPKLESAPAPLRNEAWANRGPPPPLPPPSVEWFSVGELLAEVVKESPAVPFEPLFHQRTTRGLLHALLGDVREGREVDIGRLVEIAAEYRAIRALPRVQRLALTGPVRVLVDGSESMRVFARDQDDLIDRAHRLLPRDAIDVGWFDGSPNEVEFDEERSGLVHRSDPSPGTVVLVLTDFGLSAFGTPRTEEWIEFADRTTRRATALIALTPIEPTEVPRALARRIVVVPWTRKTTVGRVRRARRTR